MHHLGNPLSAQLYTQKNFMRLYAPATDSSLVRFPVSLTTAWKLCF